jgi:exodeoxyribonuclease V alpha subunit
MDDTWKNDETQEEVMLEATLLFITFYNRETMFTVARFQTEDGRTVTCTGEMLQPTRGERYTLNGSWNTHPKYGLQFKWTSYETLLPATKDGIEQYLASGLIKGIGNVFAHKIVTRFGVETLQIMNTDIDRLAEVPGIGGKKLERIKESWNEQRGVQNVMVFLKSHGVSTAYAVRIYMQYGQRAIEAVTNNPYRLIDDVEGIGFITADTIAQKLGIAAEDLVRLKAGIHYVLREAAFANGHTFLPEDECIHAAARVLHADDGAVRSALRAAIEEALFMQDDGRIFLPELFFAEFTVAECVHRFFDKQPVIGNIEELNRLLLETERMRGIRFTPVQTEAILKSIEGPLTIITGGPGTGKTTTVIGILSLAHSLDWNVALCAPTGRAAKRMSEVTGDEAKTIHRLLEFEPRLRIFQRDEDKPLEADLVLVDEMSMVDVLLFAALIRAIPSGAKVVLMGDVDQLPPVGPGNALRDLIESREIPTITLNTIFRQVEHSSIISNSHRVKNGNLPVFDYETHLIEVGDAEEIVQRISRLVLHDLPQDMGVDPLRHIQVLAPMHNTLPGVKHLNSVLQQVLNHQGFLFLHRGERVWRVGDKVMQTKNNYEKDVYNGDIGFIDAFDEEGSIVSIRFDDRFVPYKLDELEELTLAYAITIHKSQGSEYDVVIIPLTMQHRIMLQRNLMYTAMTRAKERIIFVGHRSALVAAIENTRTSRRYSRLDELLRELLR